MNTAKLSLQGLFMAGLVAIFTATASGQALPDPTTSVGCSVTSNGQSTHINDPVACQLPGATASLTLSPVTGAFVHAEYGGGINDNAQANADITYYFQVTGGDAGVVVPLLIATQLTTNASSTDSSSLGAASLRVHGSGTRFDNQVIVCTNGSCGTSSTTFSGTLATSAVTGSTENYINLTIEAGVGDSFTPQFANAAADPYIYVDPTFANASLYKIILSDGVGNSLPVPEPGTTALMALGLATMLMRIAKKTVAR